MRPSLVRQLARTLAAAFVLASLLFAWLTSRRTGDVQPDGNAADAGQAAFAKYCGTCHAVEDLLAPVRTSANSRAALADIEAFLPRHADVTAEDARTIRTYLESRLGK
jgi:mono/diheme cytochrome c family protein